MTPDNGQVRGQNNPVRGKTIRAFFQTRACGAGLALASLIFILTYVFVCTDYQDFLVCDMAGFWERAMERLGGQSFQVTQYLAWPPGYHIFLAEVFRFLRWLGLAGWIRLETALAINILMYAASVYALQRMAARWFTSPHWTLIATLLYGFGFPAWYFNAFLLSENLALPLMVMAIAVVYCRGGWTALILGGALFGFAAIIRPSISPYGLAFVIYCLVRWGLSRAFAARAAVFSAVFFALILGAGMEVSRISQGQAASLSPNGGLQFFIANSRYHRIDLNAQGLQMSVVSPSVAWKPENGFYKTSVPFYDQKHYYQLGWAFIQHDPLRVIKNLEHVRDLFFARMFPGKETAGYALFQPLWSGFKFFMFLSFGLYLWLWRGLSVDERPLFGFCISVIGLTLLVSYLFTGEPRYTYAILFVFYLLFFKLAELRSVQKTRWKKVWLPYAVLLICGAGIVLATAALISPGYPPTMRMQAFATPMAPDAKPDVSQEVGRLLFPYNYFSASIKHADTGYRPASPARIITRTNMEITGSDPLPLKFDICSVWPYKILIDGNVVADEKTNQDPDNEDPFVERNAFATLAPGRHTLEIIFDFVPRDGGFTLCYNYSDAQGWNSRHLVGKSDQRVTFSLPNASGTPQ